MQVMMRWSGLAVRARCGRRIECADQDQQGGNQENDRRQAGEATAEGGAE